MFHAFLEKGGYSDMPPRFVIIDGNSLIHRAFHALPMFRTADGIYTNAVYGFANMLMKILEGFRPEYLAVAFDAGRVTFRNEVYQGYKADRKPTPPELSAQIPVVEDFLAAWGIKILKRQGFEAGGLIGTISKVANA